VTLRIQVVRLLRLIRMNSMQLLRIAAFLALVGLALIVWSLLDPRPIPIMVAMSVAQGLGTLSFAIFLVVLLQDAWRADRRRRKSERDKKEKDGG
jgi:uncharacterized membrane protein